MGGRNAVLGTFLVLVMAAAPAAAQLRFHFFSIDDLRLVYLEERESYIAPYLARCFENSLHFHERLFDFKPSEEVTILLQDFDDYGYAGATAMPLNYLTLGIEPFEYVYETSPTNERINWVMSHELLHVVASDQAAPRDRFFRKLFSGKVAANDEDPVSMLYSYLTTPRMYAPRWFHEGMAVFMETWMAGGYGRALGGYDEMVFRAMVADGAYFYDTVGLESEGKAIDFQVGQVSYLYGTRFVSYIAYRYGPDAVVAWLKRDAGTKASFRAQFRLVVGRDLDEEWRRWIEWEHQWQRANLELLAREPVTEHRPLSERPLGSVSRAYYDSERRTLYTAVNYPGELAHLAAIHLDSWKVDPIAVVPTPALYYVTSLAWDPDTRTLFYTTDNSREWRDLNAVSVDSGKTTRLLDDTRTGDLVFDRVGHCLWGVRHDNGLSTLVRITPPYDDWTRVEPVLALPFGRDLFDIDVSPDGQYLTGAMIEISGRQRLVRMRISDLLSGQGGYDVLYEFAKYSPANFVFSPDGRSLYGSSYYTGASNLFRYDFDSGEMHALTNALTGYFRPEPVSDDEVFAFYYTSEGFLPVLVPNRTVEDVNALRFLGQAIVERYPEVKDWTLPPPSSVDLEAFHPSRGEYHPLASLQLASAYPIVESYRNHPALGVRFNLMDPVGVAGVMLRASVSPTADLPDKEKLHFVGELRRWPWKIDASLNRADFYDFFGPTKTSRKGYSLGATYSGILIADSPRHLDYAFRLAGWGGLDTLPEFQNIGATAREMVVGSARLAYRRLARSIGALEPERGVQWNLNAQDQLVRGDHFPRLWGRYDFGIPLPLRYSSLWVRSAAGGSFGDRESVFNNFYFGAFGNNWVDHQAVRRYHDFSSFPGIEIDEVGGASFARMMLEWRLPPVRFKRAGVPDAYFTWASTGVFVAGLVTDLDRSSLRRELLDIGVQMDFKLVLFSNLSTTLSVGYARAFESGRPSSGELMISLKIL